MVSWYQNRSILKSILDHFWGWCLIWNYLLSFVKIEWSEENGWFIRSFIHFHSFSFIFIHFHSFSFIFIHFYSFSFIFIHFHSFSFIFIHFHSFLQSKSLHYELLKWQVMIPLPQDISFNLIVKSSCYV